MDLMKPILLLGGGGHCRSCIDVIESDGRFPIKGVVTAVGGSRHDLYGYPTVGDDEDVPGLIAAGLCALVTVGQVKSPQARIRLFNLVKDCGGDLPTVVSASAFVSPRSVVREGSIIMHQACVNASAVVGKNCIVNSQALLEHDVVIGDHCHVSTGSRVNGGVFIGAGSFIGSGAVLRENVTIGAGAVIGAGQVILKDVAPGAVIKEVK